MRADRALVLAAALLAGLLTACGGPGLVRVGVLADCVGVARSLEDLSLSGAQLPLLERGAAPRGARPGDGVTAARVAGRDVELVTGCSEGGEHSTLIEQARRLVDVRHADVVVGGVWPGDGLVLRDVARRHPATAFVVALPGPREVTLRDAPPNLFRFAPDLSQREAGLATYAFRDLGWRTAAVVADATEAGFGGAAGFLAEFCALGGRAVQRSVDGGPVPAADGVAVFGTPFVLPVARLGEIAAAAPAPVLLGADLAQSPDHRAAAPSAVAAVRPPGGGADRYAAAWAHYFPGTAAEAATQPYPPAYRDAVEGVLIALEHAGGEVGEPLLQALGAVDVELTGGRVHLDGNRAAVVSTAVARLAADAAPEVLRTVPGVDQSIGGTLPPGDEPFVGEQPCRPGVPPPWAR